MDAKAYYGAPDHPYNTIRPILHEPGPIANGTFRTAQGDPDRGGGDARARRPPLQREPHVAAMGFWVLQLVRDDSLTAVRADADRPARGHRRRRSTTSAAPFVYDRVVPQLDKPTGRWQPFAGRAVAVGDRWFKKPRMTAKVGQRLTWSFVGAEPHSVTVANGPRGFSSNYLGQFGGTYSFTPTVPGTYQPHLPDPPDDDERRRCKVRRT